jgi:acyl-[acyl carrier protein]--UDP-N-acetylglucosamine O-acyltransferase
VGLLRAGVPREEIERVWSAYRILYGRGLTPAHAVEEIVRELGEEGLVAELVAFIRESLRSRRGLIRREADRA